MRVTVEGEAREIPAIWREGRAVKMIDQRILPHRVRIVTLGTHRESCEAIRDMTVRGAGSIGVAAGYAMAQAALEASALPLEGFKVYISEAAERVRVTRPTAVNLFRAVERCLQAGSKGTVNESVEAVYVEADRIAREDAEASLRIGDFGAGLLADGARVLTHCNAGALAYAGLGTALAPIRVAHGRGKRVFVYVDETRPRSQGAKLTAWELQQEGIPYALISDNAAGFYMARGEVDAVIVGADRVAANGDTANKIGTYEKAVLARESRVPFYVAAPGATFDLACRSGAEIAIEERGSDEVNYSWGEDDDGIFRRVRLTAPGTPALNPSFDVTPARFVSAFITDRGVLRSPFRRSIREAFQPGEGSAA